MEINDNQKPGDFQPMEFKLGPLYRRVAYYTLGAFLLIPSVAMSLPYLSGTSGEEVPDSAARIAFSATLILIAALLCLWLHHWRLRVDKEGIHRRRFVKWQSWPWSDFAEGHVLREGDWVTFTFLDSAIGNGVLTLGLLGDDDTKRIIERTEGVWKSPPMPDVPDALRLNVGNTPFRRQDILLTPNGLESDWPGGMRAYRWDEVQEVSLDRTTHFHQGFETLCISLPDTEIELRVIKQQGHRRPNWRGAEAREIVAFLMNHVPEERFRVGALHGPANSLADFDARIRRTAKRERESRKNALTIVILLGAILALYAAEVPSFFNPLEDLPFALKSVVAVTILLVVAGPMVAVGILLLTPRAWRKRRRELEAEREKFLAEHRAELGERNVMY